MCTGTCLLFSPLAVVPSVIWLLFFLFQKKHSEKTSDIIRIFFWGVAIALPVVIVEQWGGALVQFWGGNTAFSAFLMGFVVVSLVEEFGKYLVVRTKAMPYAFFDEPQDAIVYMITSALGFAAIENFIYVLNTVNSPDRVIDLVIFRGVSAVLLHVVSSGALGYFLALSMEHPKEKRKFLYVGIISATLLHGVFNNFILKLQHLIQESGCARILQNVAGGNGGARCPEELFGIGIIGALLLISGIIILIGLYKLANTRFPLIKEQDDQDVERELQ